MNPATFLRVLGPEPWNVAYVEPSIRPDDGRYGENPNRMQQHYQFQVILKPDPGNPQELYLRSLEALGIDPSQHDIRFVEDNWESPALGAWGLGWEVWLDGLEITQFTYFQQAGGQVLDPVSVELTYGLERIAMSLQRARSFRDLRWTGKRTYGDVNLQGEQEHSKYYIEIADVERLRKMYSLFEEEALAGLEEGLVLPAYDYILKCSHTFNILDTRGAIGVTERQALFKRMRDLSRRVAEAYVEQRQRLEFPWLKSGKQRCQETSLADEKEKESLIGDQGAPDYFLLEIGTEELPAADLTMALNQLQERVPELLQELRLAHGEVRVLGTPRRLVVSIAELEPKQEDRVIVVKGPPASKAFDAQGKPTKAGEGFARSKGLKVKELEVREMDGGSYVVAQLHEAGKPAMVVMAEALPGLVGGLRFDRSMRWNASNVAFSRPIRWLLAMYGKKVVPFEYAGLQSGRMTRGLRFRLPEASEIREPDSYFTKLKDQGILLDQQERRQMIAKQVSEHVTQVGGSPSLDEDLLDEVTQLVEAPTVLVGRFEEDFLRLPAEVLVSVMKKHQRCFPVLDDDGNLLPFFIAVSNGDGEHLEVITDGNEQVIQARFADADFFILEDLKRNLKDFLPRLETLTFQFKLGSMLDKTHRVELLVKNLLPLVDLDEGESAVALRAAQLCKADLVSHMVVEMTSLQGIMGRYYALHSGESEAVARAIFEHYLPRFNGDELPSEKPGLLVGIADRLDSLARLFSVGLAPSGTKDPFMQRRAALGLVQNLITWDLEFDLRLALSMAAEDLPVESNPQAQDDCLAFIVGRERNLFIDQSWRYDVVDAVLAAQGHNPAGAIRAVRELTDWVARSDWREILPAYARCVRITRDLEEQFELNPQALIEQAESDLYRSLVKVEDKKRRPGSVKDFFRAFLPMIPVINHFFDVVLVMAEDERLQKNRLGLLQRIADLTKGTVDLSILEGF